MKITRHTMPILALSLLAPLSAYADSWSCSNGNLVREVHIEQPSSAPVPCSVVYKKPSEGIDDQVLWNAQKDASYCDEKASGFIVKLESWGWVCVAIPRSSG